MSDHLTTIVEDTQRAYVRERATAEPFTWRCDFCGLFMSRRTVDNHRACFQILDREDSGIHETYGVVQGGWR